MASKLYETVIAEAWKIKSTPCVPQYLGKYLGESLFYEEATNRYFNKIHENFTQYKLRGDE